MIDRLQGWNVDVPLGTLQQHLGPSGKLSGELRPSAHGRAGLRIRRQRVPEHLSDETVHMRVSRSVQGFDHWAITGVRENMSLKFRLEKKQCSRRARPMQCLHIIIQTFPSLLKIPETDWSLPTAKYFKKLGLTHDPYLPPPIIFFVSPSSIPGFSCGSETRRTFPVPRPTPSHVSNVGS